MTGIEITTATVGPFFDGTLGHKLDLAMTETQKAVAADAMNTIHQRMDRTFKHPTPYYETQVVQDIQGDDILIHDRDVIYGPWLEEGRGGTRFRGYSNWRLTVQEVDGRAQATAERVFEQGRFDG
jgi:hypothetical protein